jgi:prepilin-type N-terminal cleavage/methylation domain-containing protein
MIWLRRRLPAFRDERGVTLVELVVVVSLLAIILTFVTKGLVSMQNASVGQSLRLQNLDEGRTIMNTISRDMRTAARLSSTLSPFDVTAGSVPAAGFGNAPPYTGLNEVWFYANLSLSATPTPCPDVVHLYVDTSASPPSMKEQTIAATAGGTPPTCTYTGSYATRFVGKYLVNSSTLPVFTYYYDNAGTPTAFLLSSVPASTGLSATDRLSVNAVGLTISIRQSTNYSVPAATLVNRVFLPNVNYNPIPDP